MSNVFDLHNNVFGVVALVNSEITSDTTTLGAIIDTAGFESLEFVLQSGTITDGTYAITLEDGEEANLSDAAAVDSELVLGSEEAAFVAADDDAVKRIGYIGKKRYVRLSILSASTTSGGEFSSVALLASPHHAPTDAN